MQQKSLSQRFKYWDDERPESVKTITNRLVNLISQRNIQRIQKVKIPSLPQTNILFLTINGVPPRDKEYDIYRFPGKVINFKPLKFPQNFSEETMTVEQITAHLHTISMENTVQQIDKIVQANGNQVILVCHSYGSFISAMYCKKYPHKVKGYIGLGGPSIRFYPVLKDYTKALLSVPDITKEIIFDNYEAMYFMYDRDMKKHPTMDRFHNKFQLLSWILHNQEYVLNQVFDAVRDLPPILILSVYGTRDAVYGLDLCSQYAAYISYSKNNKMNEEYVNKVAGIFNKLHPNTLQTMQKVQKVQIQKVQKLQKVQKVQEKNNKKSKQNIKIEVSIQEQFIYFLNGVGHGVHYTASQTSRIQKIIDQYLYVVLSADNSHPKSKL